MKHLSSKKITIPPIRHIYKILPGRKIKMKNGDVLILSKEDFDFIDGYYQEVKLSTSKVENYMICSK